MKVIKIIALCLCTILLFVGCEKQPVAIPNKPEQNTESTLSTEPNTSEVEIEPTTEPDADENTDVEPTNDTGSCVQESILPLDFMGKEIGIVMSGGGAKGSYQAGALKALKELGLLDNVKVVAGCSIGAVNTGALWGSDIETLEKLWAEIDADSFIKEANLESIKDRLSKEAAFQWILSGAKEGICSRDGMIKIFNDNIDFNKLRDSEIPLYVAIANVNSWDVQVEYMKLNGNDDETIMKGILASSAIPILYSQVKIGDNYYLDGGLMDLTPIEPVYNQGVRNIIVIALDDKYTPPTSSYKDADFYYIVPSASLGESWSDGTLDFSTRNERYRFMLGYLDAMEYVSAYIEGRDPALENNKTLANNWADGKVA